MDRTLGTRAPANRGKKRSNLGTLRRTPLRERGHRRYEQILEVANQVFREIGYEAATTNAIAARGRFPVGSIYHFFPDKAAIYLALAERTAKRVADLLDRELDMSLIPLPIEEAVAKIIGPLFELYASDSGFRLCMKNGSILPEQVNVYERLMNQITVRLSPLLQLKLEVDERRADFVSRILITVVTSLMGIDANHSSLPQLRGEIIRVVSAYLSYPLEEARHGTPIAT
ncbi:MAG: TetR/AcrR family transcriptional regulator [Myxococcaceae bacterium]